MSLFRSLFLKLLKEALARAFCSFSGLKVRVQVEEIHDLSFLTPTLVIANHQNDLDVPLIFSLLILHPSLKVPADKLCFVAEEDLFLPGYFPQHFLLSPLWARLLFNFSLSKVLRSLGAFPVFKMTDLSLGRILRILKDNYGENLKIGEFLSQEGARLLSRLFHKGKEEVCSLTVKEALNWKYYRQLRLNLGSEILNENYARSLREARIKAALKQLEFFASVLKERALVLFPEGEITQTGKIGTVRGGLYRIMEKAQWEPSIFPVTINYDFLGERRTLVVLGKPQRGPDLKTDRGEFSLRIQSLLKKGMRLMFSHVGSAALYLLKRRKIAFFNEGYFEKVLAETLELVKRLGAEIDPALNNEYYLRSRCRNFWRFLRRKRYILKVKGGFLLFWNFLDDFPDRVRNPVGYYYEKIQDFPFYPELRAYIEEEKELSLLT